MAKILTTKQIIAELDSILRKTKTEIILVSPFLQISDDFMERLVFADNKEIPIKLIYSKDELRFKEWSKLNSLNSIEVFYMPDMHTKCFYNETQMIIGSMNFYEASEKNKELGILLHVTKDAELFEDAKDEIESMLASPRIELKSCRKNYSQRKSYFDTSDSQPKETGHCIRCNQSIPFDVNRPYCYRDYQVWSNFEDYDYTERFCHTCGKPNDTNMNFPQCKSCYNKNKLTPDYID